MQKTKPVRAREAEQRTELKSKDSQHNMAKSAHSDIDYAPCDQKKVGLLEDSAEEDR